MSPEIFSMRLRELGGNISDMILIPNEHGSFDESDHPLSTQTNRAWLIGDIRLRDTEDCKEIETGLQNRSTQKRLMEKRSRHFFYFYFFLFYFFGQSLYLQEAADNILNMNKIY